MGKTRIFLHIGMHKTATTSLQAALNGFSDGRTRYARLLRQNHSVDLITLFSGTPERHPSFARFGAAGRKAVAPRRETARDKLQAELNSDEPVLVLSGEAVVDLKASEVAAMRDHFHAYTDDIRCLAYIREPVGFASSAFQQRVKGGQKQFDISAPRYRDRFEKFIHVFGADQVTLIPFDLPAFRNGCIITDFCDRVGIDATSVPKPYSNEALSAEVTALLLEWNARGLRAKGSPARVAARKAMTEILRTALPGKLSFAADAVLAATDPADCKWVEAAMGAPLPAPSSLGQIRTAEDLARLAEDTRPALHDLLKERGLKAGSPDRPIHRMMNTLYRDCLRLQQTEPT
jgi:hypothetical protein